jgi:hypothetical protein
MRKRKEARISEAKNVPVRYPFRHFITKTKGLGMMASLRGPCGQSGSFYNQMTSPGRR